MYKNKETLLSYTNISCNVRCLNGFDHNKKCGECSPYKLFYWLDLATYNGECDLIQTENYRYVLETGYFIDYCFKNNNPVQILIVNPNSKILIEIYQWDTNVNKTITIPYICKID